MQNGTVIKQDLASNPFVMPELPEVESFRKYVSQHALNQKIRQVTLTHSNLLWKTTSKELERALEGNTIVDTSRHGKFLFILLREKGYLMLHFGMTGDIWYGEVNGTHSIDYILRIDFLNEKVFLFSDPRMFGEIALIENIDEFIRQRGYGSDALKISEKEFMQGLAHRKTAIKTVLINQKIIAGIGNEFSDAILFQCKIHPASHSNSLTTAQLQHIYKVMHKILKEAVSVDADRKRLNHYFLLNQRRAGLTCVRCKEKTASSTIGGRTSYFCPFCQVLYEKKDPKSFELFE